MMDSRHVPGLVGTRSLSLLLIERLSPALGEGEMQRGAALTRGPYCGAHSYLGGASQGEQTVTRLPAGTPRRVRAALKLQLAERQAEHEKMLKELGDDEKFWKQAVVKRPNQPLD